MTKTNAGFRALKISELRGGYTNFALYHERDGELVPYTSGRHKWSEFEKEELRQSRQFVLFYPSEQDPDVHHYLDGQKQISPEKSTQAIIDDGLAEFLKTRSLFPATAAERRYFRALAVGLSRYMQQQNRVARLLESLAHHDPYSFYQGMRTAALSVAIDQVNGRKARSWEMMLGAILHDLGNLTIEPGLLQRAGPLSEAEWRIIRRHTEDGLQLLQAIPLSPLVRHLILQHHERCDGQGYPHRQRLLQLAYEVRLLNFVDTYAALTEPRAYQKAQDPRAAHAFMASTLGAYIDTEFLAPLARLL